MSTTAPSNFIRELVRRDVTANKHGGRVATRFPPEPNGYLHIGHAKSICLNFGVAAEHAGGVCHLRFDDTNPETEDDEYVRAIQEDVHWLGFDWGKHLYFASDYFEQLYEYAVALIKKGKAYVCDLSMEDIRRYRGTLTQPGAESPYRNRLVEENLDLFARMRAGEFPEGARVLRARIDMAAPNLKLRDPPIYRIRHARHHRQGDAWCIYPMYDFAHCLSDAIERITHSVCTLEFENNRALYDWFLEAAETPWRAQQIEFARLNLSHTVMSKRLLLQLVQGGLVSGWDDPRLPTLAAMRRRGYPPAAIRRFCDDIGVARADNMVDMAQLEHAVRDELNPLARRVLAVLRPVRLVIDNYPADQVEELPAPYFPDDPPRLGTRLVPFSRVLYIERDDFMEQPTKKFYRLAPGREVRLRWAYMVTCTHVTRDPETNEIQEIHATYDPATRGGNAPDGRVIKGTLHWVSAEQAVPAEVRLYDRLLTRDRPSASASDQDFKTLLNPASLERVLTARLEQSLAAAQPHVPYQFERLGYFCVDARDSRPGQLVFNRTVPLKDSWAKLAKTDRQA